MLPEASSLKIWGYWRCQTAGAPRLSRQASAGGASWWAGLGEKLREENQSLELCAVAAQPACPILLPTLRARDLSRVTALCCLHPQLPFPLPFTALRSAF